MAKKFVSVSVNVGLKGMTGLNIRPKTSFGHSLRLSQIPHLKNCGIPLFKFKNCGIPARTFTSRGGTVLTIREVTDKLYTIVNGEKFYRMADIDEEELLSILPTKQEDLPPQPTSKSFSEAIIPLGSDEGLRQIYLNPVGTVRLGRILEDLDIFAVWLSYKHLHNPKQKPGSPSPFNIVTALVDEISLIKSSVKADRDIKFSGCISWTGRTSIEAHMNILQMDADAQWQEIAIAKFVMVARDPLKKGSAFVNLVVPETEEEKELFAEGEKNKDLRKAAMRESLLTTPPTEKERADIHQIYLSTVDPKDHSYTPRILPPDSQWMENVELSTTLLCQPQDSNVYKTMFGGFLMRQAVELAWCAAYIHSKSRPVVKHIDDIWFRHPVDIGSVLSINARIVYVEGNYVQVRVIAEVFKPDSPRTMTNLFHFTLEIPGANVQMVVPKSYSESMLYLDGKRHFENALKHKK